MADELQWIRRFVDGLVRRERRLVAGTALARVAVVCAALVVCSVIAARGHWDRSAALMALVGLAAAGLWIAVWEPLLTRWRPAGDPMRQARRVEALRPELRGRLVTAVDHAVRPVDPASPDLLALVVRRAAAVARGVSARAVHPSAHLTRTLVVAAVAWVLAIGASLVAPGGPMGLLRFWGSGLDARAAVHAMSVAAEEDAARVGDLVFAYTYPDYTGLEPHRVENTTGEVRGPPGTLVEVTARTQGCWPTGRPSKRTWAKTGGPCAGSSASVPSPARGVSCCTGAGSRSARGSSPSSPRPISRPR